MDAELTSTSTLTGLSGVAALVPIAFPSDPPKPPRATRSSSSSGSNQSVRSGIAGLPAPSLARRCALARPRHTAPSVARGARHSADPLPTHVRSFIPLDPYMTRDILEAHPGRRAAPAEQHEHVFDQVGIFHELGVAAVV